MTEDPRARVSMLIDAAPSVVYEAFIDPATLSKFWLAGASGPLAVGQTVTWKFLVEGAEAQTTATKLVPGEQLAWDWGDSKVEISLEEFEGGTAITLVNYHFDQPGMTKIESALNGTEGFSIVLADLKTLLESGKSAGIAAAKARLIAARG